MNKLFKPRCLRRIILFLALMFPIVYLTGSFFFALNGSHGNVLFAQEEEVVVRSESIEMVIPNNRFNGVFTSNCTFDVSDGGYTGVMLSSSTSGAGQISKYVPSYRGGDIMYICCGLDGDDIGTSFVIFYGGGIVARSVDVDGFQIVSSYFSTSSNYSSVILVFRDGRTSDWTELTLSYPMIFNVTAMFGSGYEPSYSEFNKFVTDNWQLFSDGQSVVYEVTDTPTYSEYIFNQVFGNDNIISQLGYYALGEQDKGFAPISSLIIFVDNNVFHWGTSNAIMTFVYGYAYYAINVLVIYEIVVIVMKLILLPLKAVDLFDGKGD